MFSHLGEKGCFKMLQTLQVMSYLITFGLGFAVCGDRFERQNNLFWSNQNIPAQSWSWTQDLLGHIVHIIT